MKKILLFFLILLNTIFVTAGEYDPKNVDLTIGPEFEFSPKQAVLQRLIQLRFKEFLSIIKTSDVDPSALEYAHLKAFAARVQAKCKECKQEIVEGKFSHLGYHTFRFTFPDGWYFSLEPDVLVVEVTASPMKLSEEEKYVKRLQEYIFDSAREVGLTLNGHSNFMNRPAGHFNFGLWSAFGDSGVNFLRYFVDRANYPELSMGGFYKDYYNAPPLCMLSENQRGELFKVIEEIQSFEKRQNESQHHGKNPNPAEVSKMIMERVYTRSYFFKNKPYHFQATGLKSAMKASGFDDDDRPMEHRDHKMQENAQEFFQLGKLIKNRIEFLNQQTSEIKYLNIEKKKFSPREIISAFSIYINEMGANPDDYKNLLLPKARAATPFAVTTRGGKINWLDKEEIAFVRNNFSRLLISGFLREQVKKSILVSSVRESHIVYELLRDLNLFLKNQQLTGSDKKLLMDYIQGIDRDWSRFVPKVRIIDSKVFQVLSCSRFY